MDHSNFDIFSNPFGLIALLVMASSWLRMGWLAKDQTGVKGIYAYFMVTSGWGIIIYLRNKKEKDNKIGPLFWAFITSTVVFYFAVSQA
jgi:hypothetical protein